jgi:prepilin-type processing-associated H-X9-DG protein
MKPSEKVAAAIIVTVIIVLLGAAFVPTIGTAGQTRCTSNLRAMSLALATYCGDQDQSLPPAGNWAEALGTHYLEDITIATCPLARPTTEHRKAYEGHELRLPVGYALFRPMGGVRNTRVFESEKIPMLYDADLFEPNANGDLSVLALRHAGKKANICFADGHVDPVTAPPAVPAKLFFADDETEEAGKHAVHQDE